MISTLVPTTNSQIRKRNMKPHPVIVDRNQGVAQVWNDVLKAYYTYSFEFIEDLAELIKNPQDVPGIMYKHIDLRLDSNLDPKHK